MYSHTLSFSSNTKTWHTIVKCLYFCMLKFTQKENNYDIYKYAGVLWGFETKAKSLLSHFSWVMVYERNSRKERQKMGKLRTPSEQGFSSCAIFLALHAFCCTILRIFAQFCRSFSHVFFVIFIFIICCTFMYFFSGGFGSYTSCCKLCPWYFSNSLLFCSRGVSSVGKGM